jgi:hypothetical protein
VLRPSETNITAVAAEKESYLQTNTLNPEAFSD